MHFTRPLIVVIVVIVVLGVAGPALATLSTSGTSRQWQSDINPPRDVRATCLPHVHDRIFQIQSQGSVNYYWTLEDCLSTGCEKATLRSNASVPGLFDFRPNSFLQQSNPPSTSSYNKFSVEKALSPPYEISATGSQRTLCINAPSGYGSLQGSICRHGQETGEQFRFDCKACNDSAKRGTVM
ncbi:hypothetical protein T439DRAFT_384178, partial [Meredithblackwellia eburnea MCA 4105]